MEAVKRELVEIDSHIEQTPWISFEYAEFFPDNLLVCYEIGIMSKKCKYICPVYVGATRNIRTRIAKQHAIFDSNLKHVICEAINKQFTLFVRFVNEFEHQGKTACHAFKLERRLLKTCDYAWNLKDNGKFVRRPMCGNAYNFAALNYYSTQTKNENGGYLQKHSMKLPLVALADLTREEIQEIHREQNNNSKVMAIRTEKQEDCYCDFSQSIQV